MSYELLIMQFSLASYYSSLLGPNTLTSTLFSNTNGQHYSLNDGEQVTCPYKSTDKIIFLSFYTAAGKIKGSEQSGSKNYPCLIRS
jgi:hypothetical protein